jgi:hypothetical protein
MLAAEVGDEREGFPEPCSCRDSVFVDEPAEQVATLDCVGECLLGCVVAVGWVEREGSVRARGVVVDRESAEYMLEVAATDDQHPIETLGADGANARHRRLPVAL